MLHPQKKKAGARKGAPSDADKGGKDERGSKAEAVKARAAEKAAEKEAEKEAARVAKAKEAAGLAPDSAPSAAEAENQ